jgi:hypothetical protein
MKGWKWQSKGFTIAQAYSRRCKLLPEYSWQLVKLSMCVDLCARRINTLLTFHFTHQRVSANRTDLEQLEAKLQSILSIISKYREYDGLRALDCRIETFCLYVVWVFVLSMPVWHAWILLRAINLEIDAVQEMHGKSLWSRTLQGTKDADTVLKAFRNISSLCDMFQVSYRITDNAVCPLITTQRSIPSCKPKQK